MGKTDENDLRNTDFTPYEKVYSESKFLKKLQRVAHIAGKKVVYAALLGYYLLADKNVPLQVKAKIVGALGYFILPIDLIPDAIPLAGYSDDLSALFWALISACEHITPEMEEKAKRKMLDWFDEIDEEDIKLF